MKISDILERFGWTKDTKSKGYMRSATIYKHPRKSMEFFIKSKELWINGKLSATLSTTKAQDEVVIDEANGLMIVGNDIAIHVG